MTSPLPTTALLGEAELVRLLAESGPRLHGIAARLLGDEQEARDAVQEAWIRAWGRRGQLRDPDAVAAWLRVIVVRECLRVLRWRAVRRWIPFGDSLPDTPSPLASPESAVAAGELAIRARRAAAALPPRQRVCFVLRFDEGWTVAEIAAATGIGVDTVKTHLGRALAAVQEATLVP